FFFQAEDGIRDKLVTGVQTCALPISTAQQPDRRASQSLQRANRRTSAAHCAGSGQCRTTPPTATPAACARPAPRLPVLISLDQRSEERRVGKECRSRRRLEL